MRKFEPVGILNEALKSKSLFAKIMFFTFANIHKLDVSKYIPRLKYFIIFQFPIFIFYV